MDTDTLMGKVGWTRTVGTYTNDSPGHNITVDSETRMQLSYKFDAAACIAELRAAANALEAGNSIAACDLTANALVRLLWFHT